MYSFPLLCLTLLTLTYAQDCDNNTLVDGCTVPNHFPFKDVFKPACNVHDMCYLCGQGRGVSRMACDERFLENMREICRKLNGNSLENCLERAEKYCMAVKIFGGPFYRDPSISDCKEAWVEMCML